jgi:hypothetical protein
MIKASPWPPPPSAAAPGKLQRQGQHEPRYQVAEGDRAAVDVQLARGDAQFPGGGEGDPSPSEAARSALVTTTAHAPSDSWDALRRR